eukprot:CAMPEP_0204150174 /NCGR_PEP_ID=MMETSP0361-20130328/25044_1 /ASSEMBLY_ACC=CAM_ASM_000343 /TAXON_ID=268821 /ORGANISM="Scrippsiella Hangoei, Strain SHTV-5" /LENGTH=118 /DNA_ID=CAMNT_0051104803 /DNA_START=627 /DNA_END=980 /DNA_ORIENTATION=+
MPGTPASAAAEAKGSDLEITSSGLNWCKPGAGRTPPDFDSKPNAQPSKPPSASSDTTALRPDSLLPATVGGLSPPSPSAPPAAAGSNMSASEASAETLASTLCAAIEVLQKEHARKSE